MLSLLVAVAPVRAAFWNLTGQLGVHDPAITHDPSNNYWWVFGTGTGIQAKSSSNGTAWSDVGRVFSSGLSWWKTYVPNNSGNDVWAPDIHRYNSTWWLYYSISTFGSNTSCIGLASKGGNVSNTGWTDRGLVIRSTSSSSYNCIDPNLCFDAGGNPYLVFGSWFSGIWITKIDPSTMKPTGSLTHLAQRSNGIEAPFIVYHGGYYYLFVSIDKCCQGTSSTYKIAYGRGTSITGPFYDQGGHNMLSGYCTVFDAGNSRWVGPGGQSIYGTSVIARHAYDANNNGAPTLLINDLYWSNNWPTY